MVPNLPDAYLPDAWLAALGSDPPAAARAFLADLARQRRLSRHVLNLPRAPLGAARLAHAPARDPGGVPGLGAAGALRDAHSQLARAGASALGLAASLGQGPDLLPAFAEDAVEGLVEAGAVLGPGLRGVVRLTEQGPGLRVDAFALGAPGDALPETWEPALGDCLVPCPADGPLPPGTVALLPGKARPWWDGALEAVVEAGLGLELLGGLDQAPLALAVVRGPRGEAWGRVLGEPLLAWPPGLGDATLPLAALDDLSNGPEGSRVPRRAAETPGEPLARRLRRALADLPFPKALLAGAALPGTGCGEAELAPLPGGEAALAWCLEGPGPAADPFWAAAGAVSALATRLACVGAAPLGLGVVLSADAAAEADLEAATLGLRQAALALDLPVALADLRVAGPGWSLVLLGVGLLDDPAPPVDLAAPDASALAKVGNRSAGGAFRASFDGLFLLGERAEAQDVALDDLFRLQACVREGVRLGLLRSAIRVGAAGFLPTAVAASLGGDLGCQLFQPGPEAALFDGEGQVLASVGPEAEEALLALCATHRVPAWKVGVAGGGRVTVALGGRPVLEVPLAELRA